MAKKQYRVKLTEKERNQLNEYVKRGKKSARAITRARILLLVDGKQSDAVIAEILSVSRPTVYRVRKRYHQSSLDSALHENPRSGRPAKLTGRQEAKLTALVCSKPPEGHARWTLRLLADELVRLELVDSVHYGTVRNVLKKRVETVAEEAMVYWNH